MLTTNLETIAALSAEKEKENDAFRIFLKNQDGAVIDKIVHELNDIVTPQVDCTQCGNCCKSLMIHVTAEETAVLAANFNTSVALIKQQYIETSSQGQMIINTIPCHFLGGTTCTIYKDRFTECREFPHLYKDHFTKRLFSTFLYYAMCPIIFNVLENLKEKLNFKSA